MGGLCCPSTRRTLLGLGQGSCIIIYPGVFPIFSFYIFLCTESRFSRYFPYSPRLCAHAHHLPSSLFPLSPTRLQLLAPLCHPLLRSPRSSPVSSPRNVVPHSHGPRSPNRSPTLHRLYSRLRQTPPLSPRSLQPPTPHHPRRRREFRGPAQACRKNHPRMFIHGV